MGRATHPTSVAACRRGATAGKRFRSVMPRPSAAMARPAAAMARPAAAMARPAAAPPATTTPMTHTPDTDDILLMFGLRQMDQSPIWSPATRSAKQRAFNHTMSQAHREHLVATGCAVSSSRLSLVAESLVSLDAESDDDLVSRLLKKARHIGDAVNPVSSPPASLATARSLESLPDELKPQFQSAVNDSYERMRTWHKGNRYSLIRLLREGPST